MGAPGGVFGGLAPLHPFLGLRPAFGGCTRLVELRPAFKAGPRFRATVAFGQGPTLGGVVAGVRFCGRLWPECVRRTVVATGGVV